MTPRHDRLIARPTLAPRLANGTDPWLENAACAGQWAITDLPSHHSRMSPDALHTAMLPALKLCAGCPFTGAEGACMKRVQPGAGWHDGVVGGIVFRGGRALRLRKRAEVAA